MWKKILIGVALLVVAVLAFLTWYKFHYSMDVAESYEINSPSLEQNLLIATQGSKYKNAVVTGLVSRIKQLPVYIKVIDVSTLPQIKEAEWNVIVLIHTWESMKPEFYSQQFIEQSNAMNKLIVLTTSGNGSYSTEGVNAITSASTMSDIDSHIAELETRVKAILENDSVPIK